MTRTFIIAEIGSVHDGSFGNATRLIDVAKACGADAAKFQTHISEAETLRNAPAPAYFKSEPRWEYFRRTGFTLEQWKALKAHCDGIGIEFMSSPFSVEAVDLLMQVGMRRWKIPSGEITNLPYLRAVAATKVPVILSSGMSTWAELDAAVEAVRGQGTLEAVLQCTSEYPCPDEKVGLNVMREIASRYGVACGLSDHTLEIFAPIVAVASGATVIEKHLTFSRSMYGSDAKHSLEPRDFQTMVQGIRAAETMLASKVDKDNVSAFRDMKSIFEKSLVSLVEIPQGTKVTEAMIGCKKPGTGIPAARLGSMIGRIAAKGITADSLLAEDDFI
ncbi:MAG: N-acetylneuraminate synthase [Fibrobacteres bacterium]|nr:N-acetylneuraminate synthase [Fibrobacterota bacterium]